MQIEREKLKRQTIESFAEEHGLIMRIREREDGTFSANFKGAEVMGKGTLTSAWGHGHTEDMAIMDYANQISSERLAIGAYTNERREIDVPKLQGTI